MMIRNRQHIWTVTGGLERFARQVTEWAGGSWAFGVATAVIIIWVATGPLFHFSDTWQLVINTATTIVTFLMVFLIQRSQNKDAQAIHLKLNEIVAALAGASNRLINVEELTEGELRTLRQHYAKLVAIAKRDGDLTRSHSIEEAETRHRAKRQRERQIMVVSAPAPSGPSGSALSGQAASEPTS
jgi:low affinity Fe/Cu permease